MTDPIKQARREALELAIKKCNEFVTMYFSAMDGASEENHVRYAAACGAARQCAISIRLVVDEELGDWPAEDPNDQMQGGT